MKSEKFIKSTENNSNYRHLDKMTTIELLTNINKEDKTVADAVEKQIPSIAKLVNIVFEKLSHGGRLFYIGAGTSGRLGVVDASECPPTFGVPHELVIGIIAGGDIAIRKSVEFAEDDHKLSWTDLRKYDINNKDIVIGIAASGTTPYVLHGLKKCQEEGIVTGCITCNQGTPISKVSDYPVEVVVGPEFVTGSTRMKSGTAQKLVLNMLTTSVMIKLGHVEDNKMVDMQLSNNKLVDRGTKFIMEQTQLNYKDANEILIKFGSVRKALQSLTNN